MKMKRLGTKIKEKIKELENDNRYWLPQDPDFDKIRWQVQVLKDLLK